MTIIKVSSSVFAPPSIDLSVNDQILCYHIKPLITEQRKGEMNMGPS